MSLPRLHLVTNDEVLADEAFVDAAQSVLECCGPVAALHVRGRDIPAARLHAIADHLQAVALRTGAWLLVNDRVDIAMAVRANGVQLGARSLRVSDARALLGASAQIGCSVHSSAEARRAERDGADFIVLGTIYESASHAGHAPAGPQLVHEVAGQTLLPIIAIGGVTAGRIAELAAAGAHGAAVLGGIWHAGDVAAAAAGYAEALRSAWTAQDDRRDGTQ